jgi:hypothetical protein
LCMRIYIYNKINILFQKYKNALLYISDENDENYK